MSRPVTEEYRNTVGDNVGTVAIDISDCQRGEPSAGITGAMNVPPLS
jgi:hypothetical protein